MSVTAMPFAVAVPALARATEKPIWLPLSTVEASAVFEIVR